MCKITRNSHNIKYVTMTVQQIDMYVCFITYRITIAKFILLYLIQREQS